MKGVTIREITEEDRDRVRSFVIRRWGAPTVIARGVIHRPHELPGFAAVRGEELVGLVTCHFAAGACEVVTLDSIRPSRGIGSALLEAVRHRARRAGCGKLWLVTTNDNLEALRFYQKRGFSLVAVHRGAVARSRELKPEIPLVGNDGIPLRDEIELELTLT
jgi:ribosomal protein S18 acetylase RimI-like enzyme